MAEDHTILSLSLFVSLVLLIVYIMMGLVIEQKKWLIGHESAIVVTLGLGISLLAYRLNAYTFSHVATFSDEVFFYFLLPPILFAAGYNMRRRMFFANIGYSLLFGVLGTLITFICFSSLVFLFMH